MRNFFKRLYRWSHQTAIGKLSMTLIAVAIWLLLWHLGARRMNEVLLLPTPAVVAGRLGELVITADFWQHCLYSLLRVLSGILVGTALAIIAAVLTATGLFTKIAKFAGAGILVPITGFSNSVVSPAIEFKSEGFILGIGARMFTIAGPVIVYGVTSSVVYGIIYFITTLF
jgi:stage V sporulation protein AC